MRTLARQWQLREPLATLRLWLEERTNFRRYAKRFALRSFAPFRGSMLDFGCGDGQVASTFAAMGMDCVGVEPDDRARAVAASRGLRVHATLHELGAGEFDRIIVRHVLEHVEDPVGVLWDLGSRLKPNVGRMLVSVPNASSYQASLYREHWIGWDMPRHLWHFTPETVMKLAAKACLRVSHCTTVELKSFAVTSAARATRVGAARPAYAPGNLRVLERADKGTEIVLVLAQ
jgi:2-polyprenyl-3-methyl-5-hydroxy-6-metoxy-1,4-benzoquinol methylase